VQLRALEALAAVGAEVGFSDHSIGNWCSFGAVALGAVVIEKHFCLDKSAPGPDIACSCDPPELADLVQGIRALEQALGTADKRQLPGEVEIARIARRGVYYAGDLPAGHVLGPADLRFLRPASSLSPAEAELLLGAALRSPVRAGAAAELADVTTAAAEG
jgi:sialic acid synthase SpsE